MKLFKESKPLRYLSDLRGLKFDHRAYKENDLIFHWCLRNGTPMHVFEKNFGALFMRQ